jgi:cob(I)alamin adenosyltransferase
MAIVTKIGDKGKTRIGGKLVSKRSKIIEAVGEIDELSAVIGVAKERLVGWEKILNKVWEDLYLISGRIAGYKTEIDLKDGIKLMEQDIKKMEEELGEVKNFLRPGEGLEPNFNWLRTVTRRVEREIVGLSKVQKLDGDILIWLNRLSDYWFTLGRYEGRKS